MTTAAHDLLLSLTSQPRWWVGIINDRSTAHETKKALKEGKLSYKKTCEILGRMGYEKVREEIWQLKK